MVLTIPRNPVPSMGSHVSCSDTHVSSPGNHAMCFDVLYTIADLCDTLRNGQDHSLHLPNVINRLVRCGLVI